MVALTGTPGTGKTSVANILKSTYGLTVVHLGSIADARVGYDKERESYVVDMELLRERVSSMVSQCEGDVILEGHYAHEMPVDMVIVLRTHPEELEKRLAARGYCEEKIRENAEAEAMGLITAEALETLGDERVYEVDTTGRNADEVAEIVMAILSGNGEEYRKRINYMGEILKWF